MNVYAGPPRAITRVTLRLVPLTPIHIGDGTEWRPDEYFIDEPAPVGPRYNEFGEEIEEAQTTAPAMLCRFDQQAATRAMTAAQRNSFTEALDRGDLREAAKVLREAGRNHVLDRIPLSAASKSDLQEAMKNPLRGGAVKPFIRSGGRPYIPGSSIKGAFRTALASAALPREQRKPDEWTHKDALEAAFGLKEGRTETDPLRFLFVSDAELPEGATLIDKAEVIKQSDAHAGRGIQMHYEVTKSLSSSSEAPAFSVTVAIDERANQAGTVARPQARFDLFRILMVARHFHSILFKEETRRFFEGPTKQLLTGKIRGHLGPADELPISQDRWNERFLLLRLGRFGHFESKSLEGVRRGHFPQARDRAKKIRQPGEWGTTRTVTHDGKNNPIPFGWVIGWVVKKERLPC